MKEIGTLSKNLTGFLFLFLIFLMLTFPFDYQEVIAGFIASLAVTLMFRGMFSFFSFRKPLLLSLMHMSAYLFFLLFEILKANLQVAKIVLSPRISVESSIVSFKTELESDFGRSVLANSITLTPGTLSVEIKDDRLFIHCLNTAGISEENAYEKIAKPFEDKIKRFAV